MKFLQQAFGGLFGSFHFNRHLLMGVYRFCHELLTMNCRGQINGMNTLMAFPGSLCPPIALQDKEWRGTETPPYNRLQVLHLN